MSPLPRPRGRTKKKIIIIIIIILFLGLARSQISGRAGNGPQVRQQIGERTSLTFFPPPPWVVPQKLGWNVLRFHGGLGGGSRGARRLSFVCDDAFYITKKMPHHLLELFSGSGSVGRAFKRRGWAVTSLDNYKKSNADLIMDIRDFDVKQHLMNGEKGSGERHLG